MTDPDMTAILCRLTRCTHDGPHPPLDRKWDEGEMQRMSQVVDTWDDETRTHQPLRPRRTA